MEMSTGTRVIAIEPVVSKTTATETGGVKKPQSFGDYQVFDPNSTPEINYGTGAEPPGTIFETRTVKTQTVEVVTTEIKPPAAPSCEIYTPPWPTIIMSIIGAIIIIYAAVAPSVDQTRRLFGVIFTLLWTLIWAIILWVLWKECHHIAAWWLLLIPVALILLFFIVVIILNVGGSA